MLKKFSLISACVVLVGIFLTGCTNSFYYDYEKGDCYSTRFDDIDRNLDITFGWKYDNLYLYWDEYEGEDFNGYYIMRTEETESNKCPYYYTNVDYLEYINRKSIIYYRDESALPDVKYYYRVCVKETDREINCGAVSVVTLY